MKKLVLLSLIFPLVTSLYGQSSRPGWIKPPQAALEVSPSPQAAHTSLKGGGDIFWTEEFDWVDPTSELGWRLPEGWSLQDPDDIGYNWHWSNSKLVGAFTDEPPLGSTSQANGFLALNLGGYNLDLGHYDNFVAVNNSITSPVIDCSDHPSVLVKIEQNFRYWSDAVMLFEVTSDGGTHWASFDMKMGTLVSERVGGIAAGGKVDLNLNISDIAASQPAVQFRITWRDAKLYYWMIDDIIFMEGWNNDLQLLDYQADYFVSEDTDEGFFYALPKTQLSGYEFSGIVNNFGNLEQYNTRLQVTVTKNNQVVYNQSSESFTLYPGIIDTLYVDNQFIPEDFGHHLINFSAVADDPDELPSDNSGSALFHVTDSLFSRCDDNPEQTFSPWEWYTVHHEGDLMGVWYPIKTDIEASSISLYISRADIQSTFKVVLFRYDPETDSPYKLLESAMVEMDSTILNNHWVTVPLEKDGEGEFLTAGEDYMAAVEFYLNMDFEDAVDSRQFFIGSDRTNILPGDCWYYFTNDQAWYSTKEDVFMIRLNLNDHSNQVDGVAYSERIQANLGQNYPNPFAQETTIRFYLSESSDVELTIRDISGRLVQKCNLGFRDSGANEFTLERSTLEPGNYFYTVQAGAFIQTRKMMVLMSYN